MKSSNSFLGGQFLTDWYNLNSVVSKISYANVSFRCKGKAMRIIQLSFAISFAAKFRNEAAVTGEDLYTVVITICYYDVAILSDSHTCWSKKLAILTSFSAEIE